MRRLKFLLPLPLILLAVCPALAKEACRIPGFVSGSAPGTPVIYDAPADGAMDLGAMPMVEDPDRGRIGPSLTVTEVKNGYAHVTGIKAWDSAETAPDGWVFATDLTFVAQTRKGFAAPDPTAEVVWHGEDWLNADEIAALTGCQGDWIEVRLHQTADTPVWLRGLCDAQETTCDGVKGD